MTSLASRSAARARGPLVLIVDADRRVRHSVAELLRLGGLGVAGVAADAEEALSLAAGSRPDLVLLDAPLPSDPAGSRLLSGLRERWPEARLMLMGWTDADSAPADGSDAYVSKGATPGEFLSAILAALPHGS